MNKNRKTPAIVRVCAMIGAILLFGMYAATLVFALSDSPSAGSWLRASLFATLAVPFALYAMSLMVKVLRDRRGGEDEEAGEDVSETEE